MVLKVMFSIQQVYKEHCLALYLPRTARRVYIMLNL